MNEWRLNRLCVAVGLLGLLSGRLMAQETITAEQVETDDKPLTVDQTPPKAKKDTVKLDGKTGSEFLRLKTDREGTLVSMQTAITRYTGTYRGREIIIDLIGAVHIGDGRYYQQLNSEFENYDALLYELVAAPGTIPTPALRDKKGVLTAIRKAAQILFEFEMQLDGIDYSADNFVHADLSMQELADKMKERGESMVTIFLSMMADALKQQKSTNIADMPQIDLVKALQDPNGAIEAKRAFAKLLSQNLEVTSSPDSTLSRLLIDDRNDAALKVMAREIKAGRNKLALFYGAAHMPAFEKDLTGMGFKKTDERWVTAWNLNPPKRSQAEHIAKMVQIFQIIQKEFD